MFMSKLKSQIAPNKVASKVKLAVFDFDGVFTDNSVYVSAKGNEFVRCFRGDGLGLKRLRDSGVIPYVLSTEADPVVEIRCKKMKVDFKQGLKDKAEALRKLAKKFGIDLKNVLYLGNDINDVECLALAGCSVVVADASGEAKNSANYITTLTGGSGAVREVCDWIVESKQNFK